MASMQTRQLGTQGLRVSALGLGCMGMSQAYGPADEAESVATIQRAVDLGVTLIDTAISYGRGHNEALVGRALAGRRDAVTLATKFGIVRDDAGVHLDGRPETLGPAATPRWRASASITSTSTTCTGSIPTSPWRSRSGP